MRPVPEFQTQVGIAAGTRVLQGELATPERAMGMILFAHGSGSSRFSPRNQHVANQMRQAGFGTLLFDLLTADEEESDRFSARFRFDIDLLAARLAAATLWVTRSDKAGGLPIGYFGASTGGAAAIVAAAALGETVRAVVSRGGRPDLAGDALGHVTAPTLLIVGGQDREVLRLNQAALENLRCPAELAVVPGATHLFTEPGALEEVSRLAADWFQRHLHRPNGFEAAEPLGAAVRGE